MYFSLTKSEEDFAEEVRTWLEEHLVGEFATMRGKGGTGQEDLEPELLIEWERELAKGGWLGLDYPEELGGRAHTLMEQVVFYATYVEAKAPGRMPNMGVTLLGPTLLAFGTEEQKHRFIPPILSGEEFWCQGYSEPNAGSDLANVATKARLEGDSWVINGQKVWTSLAQFADWCFVVARTEEGTERHRGLSYLLVPMNQEGVEIRPIVQITGGSEFNEVFFTDAKCDADMVVGEPGKGWAVAMGTLEFERGASFLGQQLAYAQEFEDLLAYARATGAARDPLVRSSLAKSFCELEIMRYNNLRMLSAVAAAEDQESFLPGPEMSIGKLYWSHWHRDFGELAMNVHGAAGLIADELVAEHTAELATANANPASSPSAQTTSSSTQPHDSASPPSVQSHAPSAYPLSRPQRTFLYSRAHTIYAGSSEIQKNIIGERVLGLPR